MLKFCHSCLLSVALSLMPVWLHAEADMDFSAIIDAARLAEMTYHSEAEIRRSPLLEGYELSDYRLLDNDTLAVFVLTSSRLKKQIIAVRGTSNIENALLDVSATLVKDPLSGLFLHEGFAYAAAQLLQHLQSRLHTGFSIVTTGHSLGGALALVMAKVLQDKGYDIERVITFGQPKVTNLDGAKQLQSLPLLRIVTPLDMVPLTPPFDPMQLVQGNLNVYWHAGTEVLLLEDNRYAILEGMDSMLRATKFNLAELPQQLLGHHSMNAYLQRLSGKAGKAEQVAFEAGFSVLDLLGL